MEKDKDLLPNLEKILPPKPNLEEGELLPSKEIETPFGKTKTPPIELPPLKLPPRPDELSERQKKAFDHALGATGAQIVASIPVIGELFGDMLEDIHSPKLKKLLTPEEKEKFIKYDRTYPTLFALVRAFQETE